MATDFPVVLSSAGAVPTPPAELLAALIAAVVATNPGYTVNLPGSLIEDVSSTEVAGLAEIDSARVETINSLTPLGANDFMLSQLGQIYLGQGSAPGTPTNTSVFVAFSAFDKTAAPLPGQVISIGFTVSDGIYQYVVQDGGVTATDGTTDPLFCLATIAGEWPVPSNSVTQLITQPPQNVILTCGNPSPGLSGDEAESAAQYRARVLQSGQAISTGTPQLLKTLLGKVSGVQQRLVSVRQQAAGGWEVIVGGGDPYQVGGAIYASGLDVSTLVGSSLAVTNITQANPGVVTTAINHGYATGQAAEMSGIVGMTPLNGVPFTATVIDEKRFSIGINTMGYPPYISGGVVEPNFRNITVELNDQPDIYSVTFVNPPAQTVSIAITYSTTDSNFVSQASVAQLVVPAIVAYINAIIVGAPMSEIIMQQVFVTAVASVLDAGLISNITFSVSINGVATAPTGQLFIGDPESYFTATNSSITVNEA